MGTVRFELFNSAGRCKNSLHSVWVGRRVAIRVSLYGICMGAWSVVQTHIPPSLITITSIRSGMQLKISKYFLKLANLLQQILLLADLSQYLCFCEDPQMNALRHRRIIAIIDRPHADDSGGGPEGRYHWSTGRVSFERGGRRCGGTGGFSVSTAWARCQPPAARDGWEGRGGGGDPETQWRQGRGRVADGRSFGS